jgi:hypothetical protein
MEGEKPLSSNRDSKFSSLLDRPISLWRYKEQKMVYLESCIAPVDYLTEVGIRLHGWSVRNPILSERISENNKTCWWRLERFWYTTLPLKCNNRSFPKGTRIGLAQQSWRGSGNHDGFWPLWSDKNGFARFKCGILRGRRKRWNV